ncbi:LysR substrate-binding domain-containing protein [Kutzneria viridogrisea]|uniref:HTH lysR-type domain-containing protein n=2 Tax=Kutzneria TaxID=43356 RepID=W5WRE5_9PSEU|nr:LysR substrate-binding domain-containing protein [Kutzneria albida]AHI00735.1 hypothetical protein KALB_7377 [Kutzneria albida DSM 43870]MBA8926007.1 DNA-binding transcriptional LysR family regulator [Kutzneria viridogrisea]
MFDPAHLRSFVAVAQTLSFTQAADRLGLRQSTVSQHIRKLEAVTERQLFLRDTHTVTLTADGEAMLEFARGILATNERAMRYFAGSQVRGRLRFGASEDLVLTQLPRILREFRRSHPLVDLELTVGLSGVLHEALHAGELDLVFGKRRTGEAHGTLVWRDKLVWISGDSLVVDPAQPVPLIVYPAPSITRAQAIETLERTNRSWRVTCTSGSLNGLRAAALAGLGVVAHAQSLIPGGLVQVPERHRLPDLGHVEFVLSSGRRALRGPAAELASTILAAGDRFQAVPAVS